MLRALSAIIARHHTNLEADSALLAGLTHSIGLSPILVKAESDPTLLDNTETLEIMLYDLYPAVGAQILKNWGFNQQMIQVPAEHLNVERQGNNGRPDYTDIV